MTLTATPCRHGPPGTRRIVGDVVGFALEWDGQRHGALWVTGDTVLYRGVKRVAERIDVGTAVVHLGRVRFRVTGPLRYTMGIRDAIELCRLVEPRTIVPVHYEGWSHFAEGRRRIEAGLAGAPDVASRVVWAPIGEPVALEA
jgi:L-ascorbate metabolism protein UlaG (beta-lactamase superfamily)